MLGVWRVHAVWCQFSVDPRAVDAVLAHLAEGVVPKARAIRGFVSFVAYDDGTGAVTAVATFETLDAAVVARDAFDAWLRTPSAPVGSESRVRVGMLAVRTVSIGANHAMTLRCNVEPTHLDRAIALLQAEFLPLIRSTRGFCSCEVIRIDNTSDLVVICGFDTRVAADRVSDLTSDWIRQNLGAFLSGTAERLSVTVRLRAVPSVDQGRRGFRWPTRRRIADPGA
jgi:hypothetical protein